MERSGNVGTLQYPPACKVSWHANCVGFLCLQCGSCVMESALWDQRSGRREGGPHLHHGDIEPLSLPAGKRFTSAMPSRVGQRVGFLKSLGARKLNKGV